MQVGKLKIHYTYNGKRYEHLQDMLSEMTYEDLTDFYQKATKAVEDCQEQRRAKHNEKKFAKGMIFAGAGMMLASPLTGGIIKCASLFALGLGTSISGHLIYKRKNVAELVSKLRLVNLKYMERESSQEITGRLNGSRQPKYMSTPENLVACSDNEDMAQSEQEL